MNTSIINFVRLKNTFDASKSLLQFTALLGLSFIVIPSAVLITLTVVSIYGYLQAAPDLVSLISKLLGG
tara:strand:- start:368 stop:574 length:207 start_codon:yes stop_codon:yes gene_type:complete